MGSPSNALDVSAPTQDLMFMQASNIIVSNFVTVKLSGRSNYKIWKAQMLCLIESQMLCGIIDTGFPLPMGMDSSRIKQYDTLIKGWIFGSVEERLLDKLVQFESARQLWKELESYNNAQINFKTEVPSPGFMFRTNFVNIPEIKRTEHIIRMMKLYEATAEGNWRKAKSILKNNEDAATMAISENGNTMLHLAIEMHRNYFVKQLLMFLGDGPAVEKKNIDGRTALHAAAMVDNQCAAELLVQKRKQLLWILDNKAQSPLDIAYNNLRLNSYACLLRFAPSSSDLSRYPDAYTKNAVKLIVTSILTNQYDIALILLQKYPELALKNDQILMTVVKFFPTDLNLLESFVYPSLDNVRQKILVRGSMLFHCDVSITTLYELIYLLILVIGFPVSVLYFLLWKVLVLVVPLIKNIEKKRKCCKAVMEILSLICDQMGTSRSCYNRPILEAVRKDAYQVVDEILYHAPDAINCQDEEGHNVIQLAIKNRSEKVYNLIYHIIERMEFYRTMKDSSKNNLVHLASRLAPSYVLNHTTGAALQLQRELQWRQEVEKLLSPLELNEQNIYMEDPAMLFEKEHADLIKQGENWAKKTAESSSIIAALNVTVAFAAAITVPGGNKQESGFQKEIAFTVFGVFNASSLFAAVTSLLLFLSVHTTGFSEKDFLVSLPWRLILGLQTLFISTSAMLITFVASLFLLFTNQSPWSMSSVILLSMLPISVIVTIELPLMVTMMQSTYFSVFVRPSYIDHCKISRKNTIFFVAGTNSHLRSVPEVI